MNWFVRYNMSIYSLLFLASGPKSYQDFWEMGPYWEIFFLRVTGGFSNVGF